MESGTATKLEHMYGPAVIDETDAKLLGAEKHSNNIGEITALIEALLWIRDRSPLGTPLDGYYDSQYAADVAMGKCEISRNKERRSGQTSKLRRRREMEPHWTLGGRDRRMEKHDYTS